MKKSIRHSAQRAILRALAVILSLTCLLMNPIDLRKTFWNSVTSGAYMARADEEYGNATVCVTEANIRNAPGTANTQIIGVLYSETRVNALEVVHLDLPNTKYLDWCKIEFLDSAGQVVTGYIVDSFIFKDADYTPDEAFEAEIAEFPDSYKLNLRVLHTRHPSWHFVPLLLDKKFSDVVDRECFLGVSLIENRENDSWKSVEPGAYEWQTGKFIAYDGDNWVNASRGVVSYYLDPRNMLTDQSIFQFLELSYDAEHQTQDNIQALLNGTFMESALIKNLEGADVGYAAAFEQAGIASGANPVFLAAKVLLEVSKEGSGSTSGDYTSEAYKEHFVSLYNFFNIGAYSDKDPKYRGLSFARDGYSNAEKNAKYYLPWNTQYRSILGGSIYIAENYISKGQYTTYLMRFNVIPELRYDDNGNALAISHQYMTNISGANSEGIKMFEDYSTAGILDMDLYFTIPVYTEMPEQPCAMPAASGSPNAYLKTLEVGGQVLTPSFDTVNCTEYSLVVPASCTSIHINAEAASDKATVAGAGDIALGEGVNELAVIVKAENGSTRQYTLYVARNTDSFENYFTTDLASNENFFGGIAPDTTVADVKARFTTTEGYVLNYLNMNGQPKADTDKVATGDLIQFVDAEGKPVYMGAVFIRGDANCDGKISSADLTIIVRYILKEGSLTGAGINGADANKDGKVSSADLTVICKHVLKELEISQ